MVLFSREILAVVKVNKTKIVRTKFIHSKNIVKRTVYTKNVHEKELAASIQKQTNILQHLRF
jgi:hypothetical protein